MIVTAMFSLGDAIKPCCTAILNPRGVKPVSRTLVTPASSVVRARSAASNTCRVNGFSACSCIDGPTWTKKWTWQSIRPGIIARPDTSITSAPRGGSMRALTSAIRPLSSTITVASDTGSAPVPSIRVPWTSDFISYDLPLS